jgi:uncharacterized membrane-anchored protein
MFFCISIFAQKTEPAHQLSKEDYLSKSKNQKTMAWILTAGGGAMVVTGLVFISSNWDYFDADGIGAGLLIGGAVAVAGGITLFNASKRNEQNASRPGITFNFKVENAKLVRNTTLKNNSYPSLSLKIGLK